VAAAFLSGRLLSAFAHATQALGGHGEYREMRKIEQSNSQARSSAGLLQL
jgi:hypothetical protein